MYNIKVNIEGSHIYKETANNQQLNDKLILGSYKIFDTILKNRTAHV
jgi:hypothetical protein